MFNTACKSLVADKTFITTANSSDTIESVLGKLYVYDILSLPVLHEKEVQAMVSILDILIFVAWGPYFEKGVIDNVTTLSGMNRPISNVIGMTLEGRGAVVATPETKLEELLVPFSSGLHRILVALNDEQGNKIYRVLSQSDLVRYIHNHRDEVKLLLTKKLSELGLKTDGVVKIPQSARALDALRQMALDRVSALAIVNESGDLVGNISASDLRGLTASRMKKILSTLTQFLISQNGELRSPKTITLNNTLEEALNIIIEEKIHRLWIVNELKKPIGCLSLTDIISIVAGKY